MKKKKLLAGAAIALWSLLAIPVCAAETPEVQMIINDTLYVTTEEQVGPQLIGDRVFVPLRLVGESLEHQVQWLEQSRTVCIFTDDNASLLPEDAYPSVAGDAPITIYIDGEEIETDSFIGLPYIHESGRTMVPVRVVMEHLNCDVLWQDYVVLITEKVPEESPVDRENDVASLTDRNQGTTTDREDNNSTANSNGEEETATNPEENFDTENNNMEDGDAEGSDLNENESNEIEENTETVPDPSEAVDPSVFYDLTIQGENLATADDLQAYLDMKEDYVRRLMAEKYPDIGFTPFPENIAELYIEIGKKYNIRGDLAFAQAVKETGYFQFFGIVKPYQNNFCGLGATGVANTGEERMNGVDENKGAYIPGMHGLSYTTVEYGVEAHIQHLYAYATIEALPDECELLDPRFGYVKRGIAPLWTDLNGRWAVPGNGYGESIIEHYWFEAFTLE